MEFISSSLSPWQISDGLIHDSRRFSQAVSATVPEGTLRDHEQMQQLPLATTHSLAAALTQCLSLATFCVGVSLVHWIELSPSLSLQQAGMEQQWVSYTFGVPHNLRIASLVAGEEDGKKQTSLAWETGWGDCIRRQSDLCLFFRG